MKNAQPSVIEVFIETIEGERRDLVSALRQLILDTVPRAGERIAWNMPVFSLQNTDFCFIKPHRDHICIGFSRGAELHDPEGLLTGDAPQARLVEITDSSAIASKGLRELVRRAAALVPA